MSKAETFRRLHRGRPPGSSSTRASTRSAAGWPIPNGPSSGPRCRSPRAPTAYPIGAPPDVLPLLRAGIQGPVDAGAKAGEGPSPAALGELGATRVAFGPGLQRRTAQARRDIAAGLTK